MNLELLIVPLIFVLSYLLLRKDFRTGIITLLVLSLLLHKEVFSIYRWDILPVRVFMLALAVYTLIDSRNYVLEFLSKKTPKKSRVELYEMFYDFFSDPFNLTLIVFWLITGLSIIYTLNLKQSIFLYGFLTSIVLLGLLLYKKLKLTPDITLQFIRIYIFLAFLTALFGIFQLYLFFIHNITIGALWSIPDNTPRVGSIFWDVNHYGAFLAALMPVLGVFILIDKTVKKKVINSIVFIILLVFLLLTNSRTAWMLAFFSFITFASTLLIKKYKIKGVIAFLFALFLLSLPFLREYSIKSSPFRAKIKNYFHYRIDSFDSHMLLLRGSEQVFEKLPVLGGGYGSFFEHFSKTQVASEYFGRDPAALNTRVPAHTIWGELISETGILGLSSFILFISVVLGTIFYAALTLKDKTQFLLSAAMGSSLVGWLIAGIFYSYKSEFFWLILFFYFIYVVGILKSKFVVTDIAAFYFRSRYIPVLFLGLLSLVMIFSGLGSTHLIPWDEAIYAEIAKNMVTSNNYLVMNWVNDIPWFEKPPLYMWFMAMFMKVLGYNSWAARLPSALFGLGTVLLTYKFGKSLYNKTVGILSAFILLTTFQFLYYSRTSMLDVTLTFFITASLYFYWQTTNDRNYKNWLLVGMFSGFAVMTKGIVGLLPFFVIFIHELILLLTHKVKYTSHTLKGPAVAFVTMLFVSLPWHLYMYYSFGFSFVKNYIGYHVIQRATENIEDKGRPIYWYLIVLKVSMRLWFIALIAAFPISFLTVITKIRKFVIRNTSFMLYSYRKDLFLVIYSICIFVFFSAATSKLVWYIMPIYPVLAMIVGLFIERIIRSFVPKNLLVKAFFLYVLFMGSLFYLYINKELVYTEDLTYKQAMLIQHKDALYGTSSMLYADRIELPLLLFYSDGPFDVVDFGPLQEKLATAKYDEPIIFITKESRYRKFSEDYPRLQLDKRYDEWVLGYKPSDKELDQESLQDVERDIQEFNKELLELKEKNKLVPPSLNNKLNLLNIEAVELKKKINQ